VTTSRLLHLSLPLLLAAASGCASTSMTTARTVGHGNVEMGVELAAGFPMNRPASFWKVLPQPAMRARVGLGNRFELGARLGCQWGEVACVGAEVLTKARLTPDGSPLIVSIAPSAGVSIVFSSEGPAAWHASLPVLLGIPMGTSELVFASRVTHLDPSGSGGPEEGPRTPLPNHLVLGQTVGFAFQTFDWLKLIPEIGVSYDAMHWRGNESRGGKQWLLSVGCGVPFDSGGLSD